MHGALLCALVSGKIVNLQYHKFEKYLRKMGHLVWTCMDFNPYAHGHGHIHGIGHDNMAKFGTTMGVTIVNNIAIGIMNCFVIKTNFPFFECVKWFFVKEVAQVNKKIGTLHFSSKVDHMRCPLPKFHEFSSFISIFHPFSGVLMIYENLHKFQLQVM